MLLSLWLMEWPHCQIADVVVIVADGIATWDGMVCLEDIIAFVADGIATRSTVYFSITFCYFSLSSVMLSRTSFHI